MKQPRSWQLKKHDKRLVDGLVESLGLTKLMATLLVNRNITSVEAAKKFLNVDHSMIHDPFLLKDMDVAVELLCHSIRSRDRICIYGDYDVDGATATSMLCLFLQELGAEVQYYIPNRMSEGYSLNRSAVEALYAEGVQLIITVDNGIMAFDEVAYAKSLGLKVIVTDHHQVADQLPVADAVVNPQRRDCSYPFKGICGAGVAFKLMMGVRQSLRQNSYFDTAKEPQLKKFLAWLAIATVCDVVPLVDENRYFVREGLLQLANTTHKGLRALINICGLEDSKIRSGDLGFKIGPRINACGRLDDAKVGVRLLTTQDAKEAQSCAKLLDQLNQERRDIELGIVNEAIDRIAASEEFNDRLSVVVFDESWHEGVVGIVASRIVDRFGRPTFVLTRTENGLIKGSGRSILRVSLIDALRECSDLLVKFGGHEAAAGVTLEFDKMNDFIKRFEQAVRKQIQPDDLQKVVMVDEVIDLAMVSDGFLKDLSRLEPHGMANARPVFASLETKLTKKSVVGEQHLKMSFQTQSGTLDAIAFRKAELIDRVQGDLGVIFGVEKNTFNNRERLQLLVQDFVDLSQKTLLDVT